MERIYSLYKHYCDERRKQFQAAFGKATPNNVAGTGGSINGQRANLGEIAKQLVELGVRLPQNICMPEPISQLTRQSVDTHFKSLREERKNAIEECQFFTNKLLDTSSTKREEFEDAVRAEVIWKEQIAIIDTHKGYYHGCLKSLKNF